VAALVLLATTSRPIYDPKRRILCNHHVVAGKIFLLLWCQTDGMVLRWLRDEFRQTENEAADKLKIDVYGLLSLKASKNTLSLLLARKNNGGYFEVSTSFFLIWRLPLL